MNRYGTSIQNWLIDLARLLGHESSDCSVSHEIIQVVNILVYAFLAIKIFSTIMILKEKNKMKQRLFIRMLRHLYLTYLLPLFVIGILYFLNFKCL